MSCQDALWASAGKAQQLRRNVTNWILAGLTKNHILKIAVACGAVRTNPPLCTKLDKIKNPSVEVPSGSVVIFQACTDLLLRPVDIQVLRG